MHKIVFGLKEHDIEGFELTGDERPGSGHTIVIDSVIDRINSQYSDTPLFRASESTTHRAPDVPDRITRMVRLYRYGGGGFAEKCENFYRQGEFMADYTDDELWTGELSRYFPTYHDLNIPQLRGYFAWRTLLRQGIWAHTTGSFANIYLYELINGIGTDGVEDSLARMREFEEEYIGRGYGDLLMARNLRRWMFQLALIHNLPVGEAIRYADPADMARDKTLAVLREPLEYEDAEVVKALCYFAPKLTVSPVVVKKGDAGIPLLAAAWRAMAAGWHGVRGEDLYTACFGKMDSYRYYPMANAVYYQRGDLPEVSVYELNPMRSYHFTDGVWYERCMQPLYFNRELYADFIREADYVLRRHLKTGGYLREKPDEYGFRPLILAMLADRRRAALEAARPKVEIDLDSLAGIRADAAVTRESLLTDEEREAEEQLAGPVEPAADNTEAAMPVKEESSEMQILRILLNNGDPSDIIKQNSLMPSVVADSINEMMFDAIGDSVVECDGSHLVLIDDYIDDLKETLSQ